MSEVVDTDSQALHHLLTEAGVDWDGLSGEVARQADALLGDEQAALILDVSMANKFDPLSANKIDPLGATKNQLSRLCFSR